MAHIKPVLTAEQLCFRRHNHAIVDQVDLALQAGTIMAVVGPNGAGKSSLLKLLSDELSPSSGVVHLQGRALSDWDKAERARAIAVLPQFSTLSFPFRVREVIELGRLPHQPCDRRQTAAIVDDLLERMDLTALADRLYPELSGGEQQRVQLARVVAQLEPLHQAQPKVLMLDEPAASFDLAHQAMLIRQVRYLAQQGVAVLMVVHDLNMALGCADELVLMHHGKVVAAGDPEAVLEPTRIEQVFEVKVEQLLSSQGRRVLCFD